MERELIDKKKKQLIKMFNLDDQEYFAKEADKILKDNINNN